MAAYGDISLVKIQLLISTIKFLISKSRIELLIRLWHDCKCCL